MASEIRHTRREFIEKAMTIGVIGLSARYFGGFGKTVNPNERIHIGLIGCGGRGRAVLNECAKYPDVVVTGACDVWKERLDATVAQFKETCKPYTDFREMLASDDIDAVIIATPPHWHALQAIVACEARKDFYIEKPMTLYLGESLAVKNAVKKHGVITQVGTQIHSTENYIRVVEIIRSGILGEIGMVKTFHVLNQGKEGIGKHPATKPPEGLNWDMWCGPAPLRPYHPVLASSSYHHCSWIDYSGGWTAGMAPHIIDLPIWALELDYPTLVASAGGRFIIQDDGDAYDHHYVVWQYPKLVMTWWTSMTNSYGFDFHGEPVIRRRLGIYFHGVNGTLFADYSTFKIVPEGDKMKDAQLPPPTLPRSKGHVREWLDCIKERKQPSCSVLYHVKVDVPIVLSLLSLRLGRAIKFDPATESIVGDAEAAKLSVPEYRHPWKFPSQYLQRI